MRVRESKMNVVMVEIEELPADVEEKLRLRAFHAFYRAFDDEHDLKVRFAKAIIASSGPIRDRDALMEWSQQHGGCGDLATI